MRMGIHPAFKLLIRMLFFAGLRRMATTIRTPIGAAIAFLSAGAILFGIAPSILLTSGLSKVSAFSEMREMISGIAPFMILTASVLLIGSRGGRSFLELSPAELHFVLAGPFSDRSILTYRLITFALATLPATLLISIVASPYVHSILNAWIASTLAISFIAFISLTLILLEARWPIRISVVRWGCIGLWFFAVIHTASHSVAWGKFPVLMELLRQFREDPIGYALLWPFEPFGQLLRAESLMQIAQSSCIPLFGSLFLLFLAYALNVGFAELAAEGSDRRRLKVEKFQRGDLSFGKQRSNARWTLPTPPWLGGTGPIAWSQLLMTSRKLENIFLLILGLFVVSAIAYWGYGRTHWNIAEKARSYAPLVASVLVSYLGFLILTTAQTGLSAPLPQLLWYKSLPLAPWRIVLGIQIGTAAYLWAVRSLFAIQTYWITSQPISVNIAFWIAGALLDWVMVASINTIAGITRLRFASQGPPDILHGGRVMLLMLLNSLAMFAGVLPAVILGAIGAFFDPMLVTPLACAAGFLLTLPVYCFLTAWGLSRDQLQNT